jgi:hypothetical protein
MPTILVTDDEKPVCDYYRPDPPDFDTKMVLGTCTMTSGEVKHNIPFPECKAMDVNARFIENAAQSKSSSSQPVTTAELSSEDSKGLGGLALVLGLISLIGGTALLLRR